MVIISKRPINLDGRLTKAFLFATASLLQSSLRLPGTLMGVNCIAQVCGIGVDVSKNVVGGVTESEEKPRLAQPCM